MKVIGYDLFLDLDIFKVPDKFLDELKEKYIVKQIDFDKDNSDVEIYWGNRINLDLINRMENLKWIHFGSIGIDKVKEMDKDIIVTNSKGTMDEALASSALSFIFSLARGLNYCYKLKNKNDLNRNSFNQYFNKLQDVYNQEILIVGYGNVGKKVSEVCKIMGMNIRYLNSKTGLDNLANDVKGADYVLNLLPYTDETKCIFNKKVFGNMEKYSYYINIGRGETTDETDLIETLENHNISGAGLDVFQNEQKLPKSPLSEESPLWKMDNVIITPHIAGWSKNYWDREIDLFRNNLYRYEKSEEMINMINLKRGY